MHYKLANDILTGDIWRFSWTCEIKLAVFVYIVSALHWLRKRHRRFRNRALVLTGILVELFTSHKTFSIVCLYIDSTHTMVMYVNLENRICIQCLTADRRRRSSVNLRAAQHFLREKYVWKINKMPDFYVILARKISKMPEFYIIIARKIFFQNCFLGVLVPTFPLLPPSPTSMTSCVVVGMQEADRLVSR